MKIQEMGGYVWIGRVSSHILGLFFVNGCKGAIVGESGECYRATSILNKHISKGRAGLLPCQKELIEAGLVDFAQI
jgi:hypothetical protein